MKTSRGCRSGFSLIELSIASGLLVFLALLISNCWIGLGRPLCENTYRCRIAHEAVLAMISLARDFGGCLPGDVGSSGAKLSYRFVGRSQPGGNELWLCFDGGASPNGLADWASPDVVIAYRVVDNALVRSDQSAGVDFVVARYVDSLTVVDLGAEVDITITCAYRNVNSTYTLVAKDP
jgi:hypothetical protein